MSSLSILDLLRNISKQKNKFNLEKENYNYVLRFGEITNLNVVPVVEI